jgi:hypothetical protein
MHGRMLTDRFSMPHAKCVEAVIRSAVRRYFLTLAVENAALPVTMLLASAMVLLVLGTDILHWYWLSLLVVPPAALAVLQIRRKLLSPYHIAQLLDRRFGLNDLLSTAWFLYRHSDRSFSGAAQFEIEQAEEAAAHIQPAAALPFTSGRKWIVASCLLLGALGLFIVRYLELNTLSLRPPLLSVHGVVPSDFASWLSPKLSLSSLLRGRYQRVPAARILHESSRQTLGEPDSAISASSRADNANTTQLDPAYAKPSDNGADRSLSSARSDQSQQSDGSPKSGTQMARKNDADTAQSEQGATSLLDRMRDAISQLVANIRGENKQKTAQDATQTADQSHRSPQGTSGVSAMEHVHAASEQAQRQAAQNQQVNGRIPSSSLEKNPNAQSGIGSQNGDKRLKMAEEQEVMGKLAEIIGKRSIDLTGSVTLLAAPAPLLTPDSHQVSEHQNSGGEIHRDEIPPLFREYVRRYMEEVQKEQNHPQ